MKQVIETCSILLYLQINLLKTFCMEVFLWFLFIFMLGNNIFPVSSPKFPLISIIPIISMESFQYGIFPKFPSLTYHGNLPETFRKFTGNFPPLCNPNADDTLLYQTALSPFIVSWTQCLVSCQVRHLLHSKRSLVSINSLSWNKNLTLDQWFSLWAPKITACGPQQVTYNIIISS